MHVTDLFFLGARNHPHRLALSGDGGDFTYVETHALSNRIARRLRAAGLDVGHKFAVMSPNTSPALIAMLGACVPDSLGAISTCGPPSAISSTS